MDIRIIKNEKAYREAITHVEELALLDPEKGTTDSEKLELLALLVEDYERRNYSFDTPDPVSAIEFRMSEQGLRQRDLVPILGSRSRVSEILGRKRPLTLPMIRALSESLGISTDLLVRPNDESIAPPNGAIEWTKFPFREMQKRGWISDRLLTDPGQIEQVVKDFLAKAGKAPEAVPLYRRTLKGLGVESLDDAAAYSTFAWVARVLQRSISNPVASQFKIDNLSNTFLRELAKLSRLKDGPTLAIRELNGIGICVVIEPRLPNTLLDGAAMLNEKMRPVIGLTLRFDRADYFWFTLLHEVAHIWKHLNSTKEAFIDRIDTGTEIERSEKEANRIAREALIPRPLWTKSVARLRPSVDTIREFSEEAQVHPAIVAGRIRFESGEFNRYTRLLGQGTIRKHFPEVKF